MKSAWPCCRHAEHWSGSVLRAVWAEPSVEEDASCRHDPQTGIGIDMLARYPLKRDFVDEPSRIPRSVRCWILTETIARERRVKLPGCFGWKEHLAKLRRYASSGVNQWGAVQPQRSLHIIPEISDPGAGARGAVPQRAARPLGRAARIGAGGCLRQPWSVRWAAGFPALPSSLAGKRWAVRAEAPFAGPDA